MVTVEWTSLDNDKTYITPITKYEHGRITMKPHDRVITALAANTAAHHLQTAL
jgi:hypothetical protein